MRSARHLAVLVIAGILATAFTANCALIRRNPSGPEIQTVRDAAVKMATAITGALGIYESALDVADIQQKAGQFSTATLRDMAQIGKTFADVADQALQKIGAVATHPDLQATVAEVITTLEPLITRLDTSQNDALRAFGFSLRVMLELLQAYAGGGQ